MSHLKLMMKERIIYRVEFVFLSVYIMELEPQSKQYDPQRLYIYKSKQRATASEESIEAKVRKGTTT